MYQNYTNASPDNKNNFLWIGQPGNTFIQNAVPILIPTNSIGMHFIIHSAGGNGGNGATSNGSSNYSGGAGGGNGIYAIGTLLTMLLPRVIYIVTNSTDNRLWLSITPNPGSVTQMGLGICSNAGTGGNGVVGSNSTAGSVSAALQFGLLDIGFNNGTATNVGSAGRTGTSGAAGTDYNWSASNPFSSIGPSGAGMAATTTFVGGGASALATLRTYINTQAGGAAGSNGSQGQSFLGFNNIIMGASGSGGGSTNGGVGGNGGLSFLGSGGAGGGTGTGGGGAGSLGGSPFVFIQFW